MKFNENPSSGSRIAPCGRTDGQTDTTKLIVAFRNVATAPNKTSTAPNKTSTRTERRLYFSILILMDPYIVDDSVEIPTRCNFVIEFIIPNLYFRIVHVVIFILFKPTHALFLKHIHIHI
jgi:hypothetical protein